MVAGWIKKIAIKKGKEAARNWVKDNPGKVGASK
jgi:hypothetical protein